MNAKKIFITVGILSAVILATILFFVLRKEIPEESSGKTCYAYRHDATPDAPYVVSEYMEISNTNGIIIGRKEGTQAGPDMTNGYQGSLAGTQNGTILTLVFSYTVEGSRNREKELYRVASRGFEKLRYPLVDQGGMLVPDTKQDFTVLKYDRVGCEE